MPRKTDKRTLDYSPAKPSHAGNLYLASLKWVMRTRETGPVLDALLNTASIQSISTSHLAIQIIDTYWEMGDPRQNDYVWQHIYTVLDEKAELFRQYAKDHPGVDPVMAAKKSAEDNAKVIRSMREGRTLCWVCRNAMPNDRGTGCEWSALGKPVEGWKALHHKVGADTLTDSYRVFECPKFELDKRNDCVEEYKKFLYFANRDRKRLEIIEWEREKQDTL